MTKDGIGYNVRYEHEVQLNSASVPLLLVGWCGDNLKNKFGWYFSNTPGDIGHGAAIMTFENKKDAFWFAMCKGK